MSVFVWRRARAIFSKEFKHIIRDPFTLMIALLLPLSIVLILGNSIEFNIKSIRMAYIDNDRSYASRTLIDSFGSSDYFQPFMVAKADDGFDDIATGDARAMMVIPPNFERDVMGGSTANVQILLDGTESSTMSAISNYLTTINQSSYYKILDVPVNTKVQNPTYVVRYLFNPELNSRWFSVPGLAAVIIALVAIMLTTLTICREWERGSMEMLLSTPATRLEIIVGKVVPYAIISFIGFLLVFFVACVVFGVPFVGDWWQIVLGTMLFILGYLAIGLFISVSTKKQEVAIQYACIIGLLPTVVLSGFVFPIEYMSRGYRIVSSVFPARFYMDLTRDQFLKGSSFVDVWWMYAILALQAAIVLVLCVVRFKRTLE